MPKKILVVEDDESIQDILKIILQRAGFIVTILAHGKLIIEDHYSLPDLFLIDKQLSGIDGIMLCRHLKSKGNTKKIPVIMMSAYPNIGELSVQAGANAFIEKPFEVGSLLATINKSISEKQPA